MVRYFLRGVIPIVRFVQGLDVRGGRFRIRPFRLGQQIGDSAQFVRWRLGLGQIFC